MSVLYHNRRQHRCGARECDSLHLRNFMNSDRSIYAVKPPALIALCGIDNPIETCFQAGDDPLRTQDDQSAPLSISPNLVTAATTTLLPHEPLRPYMNKSTQSHPLSQKPPKNTHIVRILGMCHVPQGLLITETQPCS